MDVGTLRALEENIKNAKTVILDLEGSGTVIPQNDLDVSTSDGKTSAGSDFIR